MAITKEYVLVCDEMRIENNGKLFVIGMYGGLPPMITVPQIPATLSSLTFLHMLRSDRPGQWSVNFRLEQLESGQRLVDGQGGFVIPRPGVGVAPIRLQNVQFRAAGQYTFALQISEQPEPILTEFTLQLAPVPPQFGGGISFR